MAKQKAKELTPQDYMRMAIDKMEKSIYERRSDSKVNRKVGAVLIKPDGSRVYRDINRDILSQ